jgi:polygalacturonase
MKHIETGRRAVLRMSGLGVTALGLAGAPALAAAPRRGVAKLFFDVRDFGAAGDGKTLDTPAINRAIEAAAAAGGGAVILSAGDYLCFSIRLKSRVHLVLEQGATIIAADSPAPGQTSGYGGGTYDAAEPNTAWDAYQDYGHNHWHNSLIWGEDIFDISITGPGRIWGRGLSNGRMVHRLGNLAKAEQAGVGNKAIALKNCRNVQLRDFSILKGGHFGLLLTGVDNLIIDGLTIDTDRDGMDIDCCQNVRVSNCAVNSPWDDAIVPKSSFALGYARPCKNMTITNCYVSGCWELGTLLDGTFKRITDHAYAGFTGRIKLGTESNGGFLNTTISNCTFEGCQGLALETVDGALLEDLTVTNITMRDIVSCPIFMRLGARLRGPAATTRVGALRRVLISNITAHNSNARLSSIVSGIPGYAIEDVKMTNIFLDHTGGGDAAAAAIAVPEDESKYPEPGMFGPMPANGFFFRHMRGLEVSHTEIRPLAGDARPAFQLEDVTRADFFAVTAPGPAFALKGVKDFRLGWSRAAPDAVIAEAANRTL